ncbi:uncharacterized protein LOC113521771 [Galleria mellonella]|uniref:Uncharacterized protein LOC113521771 n=1 Tax=Galleria mellonella TaxID=7137 RepID=A0A6J1X299_GALME|nr:uncharacterized protein LOC113521771 [Galleria mellonella]
MPLSTCTSGLVVTALVALLLLPAQYYVPNLYFKSDEEFQTPPQITPVPTSTHVWFDLASAHVPPLDLIFTIVLLTLAFITYIFEWIQRKIMERRIMKLNQYLSASLDRLRAWDARQEQLEGTLRMVHNATAEYNLLLYLLLRKHRCLAAHAGPPSNCFFDKDLDDELFSLRNPNLEPQVL